MGDRLLHILRAITFSMLVLFQFCAQRAPISGGNRDVDPPVLIKATPDTFSTNFSQTKIRLDFNEFVQLTNVRKNLLITPILRYEPVVLANGKKILIKNLDDSLLPNTTYVMEFNEAIHDITEKNSSKGLRYVFSTGEYVDSLKLSGELKDAYTLKPLEDAFVYLYEDQNDSTPYLNKPRYVGRTNEEGIFTIQNMKMGEYKVFMITDENRNYLFDKPDEKIDFLDKPIQIRPDTVKYIQGKLFAEESGNQFIRGSGYINKWAFYLSFNFSVDTLNVISKGEPEFSEESFARSYNEERDSVVFWLTDSTKWKDSRNILVKPDTFPTDTLSLAYYERKKAIEKLVVKQNFIGGKLDLGRELENEFQYPVVKFDESKVKLFEDSNLIDYTWKFDKSLRKLTIVADWKEKRNYKLITDSAAFINIEGMANDSTVRAFSTNEANFYGTMDITLSGFKGHTGILFLMDKNEKIVESVILDNKLNHFFEYLRPGEYYLKYIIDENANGKWTAGNYLQKRHAEPVFIYQGSITIRSNWDQVIEWKFK